MITDDCKLQIANCKLQIEGGRQSAADGRRLRRGRSDFKFAICKLQFAISPFPASRSPRRPRRAFTLVELLVVVAIIGLLATMVMGGLGMARESAREAKTKATIAKINEALLEKYDAYQNRRPVAKLADKPAALDQLMKIEMPTQFADFQNLTTTTKLPAGGSQIGPSSLALLYAAKYKYIEQNPKPTGKKALQLTHPKFGNVQAAKCLYMIVTTGSPESRPLFGGEEYADISDDCWPVFVDGWNEPITFTAGTSTAPPRVFSVRVPTP